MLLPSLFIIVFPFLVYYISTNLFYRRANSKALRKTPPTVPYFIPGVFHAFTLAYEGPQKFFATLLNQYGSFAPFMVRIGFGSFVVIRDPNHLKIVMLASKPTDLIAAHDEMVKMLFDAQVDHGDEKRKKAMHHMHLILPQKYLTDSKLTSLTDKYLSILSSNLNNKMFQVDSWTQIEDFLSFFQQVVVRCTMETFFGSALFKRYSGIVKEYQKFADSVDDFMLGIPAYAMSTAYKAPRDRLLEGIERWLDASHAGLDFAKIADEDPEWDEVGGSKFIQERDSIFAKLENINLRTRAVEILSVMLVSNSSLISPAFWTIIETLRKPHDHEHLVAHLHRFHSPQSGAYDIANISTIPLLQSILAEIKRLRTSTVTVRKNHVDGFQLDENWALPKDTMITFFSHDFSTNKDLWAKLHPRAIQKSLEEFWPGRFLLPDTTENQPAKTTGKKDVRVQNTKFSSQSLEPLSLFFDNNDNLLGREYVNAMQTATLAVFLTQFELQLCDADAVDASLPPVREVAYGMVKPLERIAVRIRKRRAGKGS